MRETKAQMLQGVEGVESAKIVANNTLCIDYEDGRRAWRLHRTDIVTLLPNGNYVLNSGGWRTPTTKDRINKYFLGGQVYQMDGAWYISKGYRWDDDSREHVDFFDGIELTPDCVVVGSMPEESEEVRVKTWIKKINKFVSIIDDLPGPPPIRDNDCLFCNVQWEKPEHVKEHIENNQMYGILIIRALEAQGRNVDFIYNNWHTDIIKMALRRYLKRCLGIAQ